MTQNSKRPSEVVGQRVREVRRRRGWSADDLVARCQQLGVQITRQAISNIENGRPKDGIRRRQIDVEELLFLSLALGVAPVHLLVPVTEDSDYAVTSTRSFKIKPVRNWVRGEVPLPGTDEHIFETEVPREDAGKLRTTVTSEQMKQLLSKLSFEQDEEE